MSKTKYTPGPWKIEIFQPMGSPPREVAVRTSTGTYIYAAEPNARLISAAPELLAFVKICLEFFKNGQTISPDTISFSDDDYKDALDIARELVFKATGEENE